MSLIRRAFEKRVSRELGGLAYGLQIWWFRVVGEFHVEWSPNQKYVSQTPIPQTPTPDVTDSNRDQTKKSGILGCTLGSTSYDARSVTPSARKTSSSMKKFPVQSLPRRIKIE